MFKASGAKPSLLLVDDDADVGEAFRRHAFSFFNVVPHTDPRRALARVLEGNDFSAVLSDFKMPGMDGISFLTRVKAVAPQMPLFLFTGVLDHPDFRTRVSQLGIRGMFFKPLNSIGVVNAIRASFVRTL